MEMRCLETRSAVLVTVETEFALVLLQAQFADEAVRLVTSHAIPTYERRMRVAYLLNDFSMTFDAGRGFLRPGTPFELAACSGRNQDQSKPEGH